MNPQGRLFFDCVIDQFESRSVVGADFDKLQNMTTVKKICDSIIKREVTVNVLGVSQVEKVVSIVSTLQIKYNKEHEEYQGKKSKSTIMKRNRSEEDFIMMKVPRDAGLRHKYLLEYLLKTTDSSHQITNDGFEAAFASVTNITSYADTTSLDTSYFFNCGFEEARSQIEKFTNCIIEFDGYSILVNSFDIFYHNHRFQDDCAQYLNVFHKLAIAKVSRKTYTNKYFTEVTIFLGHYELLVVGGYFYKYGSITPFLGSSMDKFKLEEGSSKIIKLPADTPQSIRTERLLNQYFKRSSHFLWGFRCSKSYLQGFYPINPTELLDHNSQKSRKLNNCHFYSAVLAHISSPKAIKAGDIDLLWSLFTRLPFFRMATETANTKPLNFGQMADILDAINNDSPVAVTIRLLKTIETNAPCFFLSLYNETDAKKISLKLVQSGLKREINNQHEAIVKKFKKEL